MKENIKSLVIYFHPLPKLSFRLKYAALWVGDEIVGYVRAEINNADDAAKPDKGETVLSSVEP